MYQAARVLRNANEILESLTHKLELINDAVQYMREKVDHVSKHMNSFSSVMGTLTEKFIVGKLTDKLEKKLSNRKKASTSAPSKKKTSFGKK